MNMINHPPHLLNKEDLMMPSALIPFCFFDSVSKGKVKSSLNFSFPVCDQFDPVVIGGDLCYQMDMAEKMPKKASVQGQGIRLFIDANIEKSVVRMTTTDATADLKSSDQAEIVDETQNLVRVNIGTLAPYFEYGPGNYILTVVKQMTATDGFHSMSSKKRKCEKERFHSCQKTYFYDGIKKCGCTPQRLIPALKHQPQVINYVVFL